MSWGALTGTAAALVHTLNEDLNIAGTYTLPTGSNNQTFNGAFNLNLSGSLNLSTNTGSLGGTSTMRLIGTGTVSSGSTALVTILTNIDAGTNTITITSPVRFDLGNLKYLSGAVTSSNGAWVFPSGGGGVSIFGN